jgi:hypothetical protein
MLLVVKSRVPISMLEERWAVPVAKGAERCIIIRENRTPEPLGD